MTKTIQLTKGYVAIVDDEDYDELSKYNWHAWTPNDTGVYARRRDKWPDGRTRTVMMHRQIMGEPEDLQVDHRDRNGLNCRRKNLRSATHGQNMSNRNLRRRVAPYKGLHRQESGRWQALIRVGGVLKGLGTYDTPEEAARVYDAAARIHQGEFAALNFPGEGAP